MKDFEDYLSQAEYAFFTDVAKLGGMRFSSLDFTVRRSGGSIWLEYVGENASDIPMEGFVSLVIKPGLVLVAHTNKHPQTGTNSDDQKFLTHLLTPDSVCDLIERFY